MGEEFIARDTPPGLFRKRAGWASQQGSSTYFQAQSAGNAVKDGVEPDETCGRTAV